MQGYKYNSPKGEMSITFHHGQWSLNINGQPVRSYTNASFAAWDVADHRTGVPEWDRTLQDGVPNSLGGWEMF